MTGAELTAALIAAVSAGAAAALKDTAADAVKSAYSALKDGIRNVLGSGTNLSPLEEAPTSTEAEQAKERLSKKVEVAEEPERVELAKLILALNEALRTSNVAGSAIDAQIANILRTEIENFSARNEGGRQELNVADSKMKNFSLSNEGKKNN